MASNSGDQGIDLFVFREGGHLFFEIKYTDERLEKIMEVISTK